MITCKHVDSIENFVPACRIFDMINPFQVLAGFRVDNDVFELEGWLGIGMVIHNLADGLREEEMKLGVIFLKEMCIDWLLLYIIYSFRLFLIWFFNLYLYLKHFHSLWFNPTTIFILFHPSNTKLQNDGLALRLFDLTGIIVNINK